MKNFADYSPPPDLLRERVILVTGAGGTIGSYAARSYAAHGATVLLLGGSESRLAETYDAIISSGHPQPVMIPFDLGKATLEDYQTLVAAVAEQFGVLHGIVHTAAYLGTLTPLEHYDLKLWSRVVHFNLHAPYLLTRHCLPLLKNANGAAVIFLLDELGRKGQAYWGPYAIAQAGLKNLAEIFADELEANTHIRVYTFTPPAVQRRLRSLAYPGENPSALPTAEILLPHLLYLMAADCPIATGQHLGIHESL